MVIQKKDAVLSLGQDGEDTSIAEVFARHDQALVVHGISASEALPTPLRSLPPELQRAVQVLCETYETLDLRIETTLVAAADDFVTALNEVEGHEVELRQMVALLISDLNQSGGNPQAQQILLRLIFQNEDDLAQQMSSIVETQGKPT